MRLQAFLARAGAAPSRRKAEAPILAGRVTVNGETATLGARVTPGDEVELDGHLVRLPEARVYLALNKPAGYLTTMDDDRGRPTIAHLMPEVPGLVPVGRLDATTTGLLILTNDGGLAHRIAHPSSEIEKRYRLTLENPAPQNALAALAAGPTLEDGKMHPAEITNLSRSGETTTLDLTIHEGRNRIIRRACMAVGLALISLHRTNVGPVALADLPEGHYRALTPSELEALR
ncbi:MAG TPA: pseudouridine synthase [Rubrobacter sp.]|nr:pseudouridine synthase [Rubrobacter sp.]